MRIYSAVVVNCAGVFMLKNSIRDENLRLVFAKKERRHIEECIRENKIELALCVAFFFLLPLLAWVFLHGEERLADTIGQRFGGIAALAAYIFALICIFAPFPLLIATWKKAVELNKHLGHLKEHQNFLKKYNREI